ncbi:MAG: hypothetical protein RL238_1473 [Actinomycetota bacterium]|jgi:hypothetical protein
MNDRAPLVSVVTPTYNRADYIAATIDSVLAQDHRAIEVIVVDDGSTDGTEHVLAGFGDRITVIRQANQGQATAVNVGLGAARGTYVTLVSDDDPLLPGALSRLVLELESRPDVLVAFPDWYVIDGDGERTALITGLDYSLRDSVRHHLCMPGPCALFRRSVLEQVGGWDTRYRWVADYDFWLRIGLLGPFVRVPEPLATWREHSTTATTSSPRVAMAKEQAAVILDFFRRDDLPPEIRELEAEATSNAYFIAAITAAQELEPANVPRFEVLDRWASSIEHPIPPLRRRDGTTVDRLSERVRLLERELERTQLERDTLERHIDVLRRHLAALGAAAPDGASVV